MKLFIFAFLAGYVITFGASSLDCQFDNKRAFCQWKREWFGMRRAGWRSGKRIRNSALEDHTNGQGKFIYFLARSRPTGFRSRIRSPAVAIEQGTCFVFWLGMGGSRKSFPDGNSVLRIYMVSEEGPVEAATPIWTRGDSTSQTDRFQKIVIPLDGSVQALNGAPRQFVIETIRGGSKKAFVALDDVSLQPCAGSSDNEIAGENDIHEEAGMKMKDVKTKLLHLMLPATRGEIGVIEFPDSNSRIPAAPPSGRMVELASVQDHPVNEHDAFYHELVRMPAARKQRRRRKDRRHKKRKRQRKHRRNKNNSLKRGNGFGAVMIEEQPRPIQGIHARPADLNLNTQTSGTCDFIEYTQRLHRCFRSFFSMLQKRPKTCGSRYLTLESCVLSAATSCVSSGDMDTMRVEEIVIGTLRNNFQTEKVFCEEEGAFVYPEFAVEKLPIQCGNRYLIKLNECSGSFSTIFRIQHGDPKLCKEYYSANECQRQTTADECNFDTETMLLYGLSLQYQFAHNPFCLHLPFSSWWPES